MNKWILDTDISILFRILDLSSNLEAQRAARAHKEKSYGSAEKAAPLACFRAAKPRMSAAMSARNRRRSRVLRRPLQRRAENDDGHQVETTQAKYRRERLNQRSNEKLFWRCASCFVLPDLIEDADLQMLDSGLPSNEYAISRVAAICIIHTPPQPVESKSNITVYSRIYCYSTSVV